MCFRLGAAGLGTAGKEVAWRTGQGQLGCGYADAAGSDGGDGGVGGVCWNVFQDWGCESWGPAGPECCHPPS